MAMERYVIFISILFFFVHPIQVPAQGVKGDKVSVLKEFEDVSAPAGRFRLFFESGDRYNVNSAYDWLDTIKIYLANSEKTKDSVAIGMYKVMEAQIYNDLGVYDKSIAIAKELHEQRKDS